MADLKQALNDFVATSNSGKYEDEEVLMSKFPELKGYDKNVLNDYLATSNSGKYESEDELNSKFPELFEEDKKKKLKSKPTSPKRQSVLESKKTVSNTLLDTGIQKKVSGQASLNGKFNVGSSGYIGEVKPFEDKTILKPTQEQTDAYIENERKKKIDLANKAYEYAKSNVDIEKSKERLNDEVDNNQFTDAIVQFAKNKFNYSIGEPLTKINEYLGGDKDFKIGEYKPLQNELKQARKELFEEDPKKKYSQEQVLDRAKKIFIDNDVQSQFHSYVDSYLPSGYDREGVWKELKLKQLRSNDVLRSKIASAELFKTQIEEFQKFVKEANEKGPTEEDFIKFKELKEKALFASDGLSHLSKNYDSLLKEAKSDEEKIELFKYNYDNYDKSADLMYGSLANIVGGATKLLGETNKFSANKLGVTNEFGQLLSDVGSDLMGDAEEATKPYYRYKATRINNFSDLGSVAVQLGSEQLPVLATMYLGGNVGMLATSMSSGGQKIKELEDGAKVPFGRIYTDGQKLAAGWLYAGAEFIPEKLGTGRIFKDIERTVASASSASRRLFKESLYKTTFKGIGKYSYYSGLEGGTELLTAEGQIKIDEDLLDIVKSDFDKKEMRSESYLSGMGMGGSMAIIGGGLGFVAAQSRLYSENKDLKEVQDILKRVGAIQSEIDSNVLLSSKEKTELFKEMNKLNNKAFEVVARNAEKGSTLSVEEKSNLLDINLAQNKLKEDYQAILDSNYSKEIKNAKIKEAKQEFKDLENKRSTILNGDFNKLTNLSNEEQIRLKDLAQRKLREELNPDGTKNIKLDDKQITEEAIKIYESEKSTTLEKPQVEELGNVESPVSEIENKQKVEELRSEEQNELSEKLPEAERKEDGKVDVEKLSTEDKAVYDEVYDKYDKLITPLLEKPQVEELGDVQTPVADDKKSDYKAISQQVLDNNQLNTVRASLRASSPDSLALEVLDAIAGKKSADFGDDSLNQAVDDAIQNGVSIGTVANLIMEDDVLSNKNGIDSKRKAIDYALNIGGKGTILKAGQEAVSENQLEQQPIEQDKGALDTAIDWLDEMDVDLKKFGEETLGINVPVVVARGAIKAMKVVAQTAKTTQEIIDAGLEYVRQTDWYKAATAEEKIDADNKFTEYVNKKIDKIKESKLGNLAAKRKSAVTNLSKGRIDKDQFTLSTVGRFLAINPKFIPDELKVEYSNMLNQISGRVIGIKDKKLFLQDMTLLTNKLEDSIIAPEEKVNEEKESNIEETQAGIIENIGMLNSEDTIVSTTNLDNDSKQMVDFVRDSFNKGTKYSSGSELMNNWLNSLSKEEANKFLKALDALNKGLVTSALSELKNSVDSFKRLEELKPVIESANKLTDIALFSRFKAGINTLFGPKMFGNTEYSKSSLFQKMASMQKYAIDPILGNVMDHPIYKTVFGKTGMQFGAHNTYKSKEQSRVLNPIEQDQHKFYNGNPRNIIASNIRQTIYTIQRMHLLGGNPKVNKNVSEYIKNAVDRNSIAYEESTKKMIQEEYDKFLSIAGEDGANIEDYFNSLNNADKKMITSLDNFYSGDISSKAASTSYFDEQRALNLNNSKIYRPVDFFNNSKTMDSVQKAIAGMSEAFLNPSMKAGNLKEKTGATGSFDTALNFTQPMNTANSYLADVSLQYHVLNETRVTSDVLTKLISDSSLSKSHNQLVNMIQQMYVNSVDSFVNREYSDFGIFDKIQKSVVTSTLAGGVKAVSEFTSNVINSATHIKSLSIGMDVLGKINKEGIDFAQLIYNLKIPQGERIIGDSKSAGNSDIPFEKRIASDKNLTNQVKAKLTEMYYRTRVVPGLENLIEKIHDGLISSPDSVVAKPFIIGMFDKSFTEMNNGVPPDYKKISENDVEYMDKHRDIIESAVMDTDIVVSQVISSKNPMTMADQYVVSSKDSDMKKAITKVNSFFRNHQSAQGTGTYIAIKSAMNNGAISKSEAAFILAQKVASQAAYSIVNNKLKSLLFLGVVAPAFGIIPSSDEEEEDGEVLRDGIGALFGLATANMGSISANTAAYLGSIMEAEYGEELGIRSGDFNPSKSAIQSSYNPNKTTKENVSRLGASFIGAKGLVLDKGIDIVQSISEKDFVQAGRDVFSLTGKNLLYKDFEAQRKMIRYQGVPNIYEQEKIIKSKNVVAIDRMDFQKKLFMEDVARSYLNIKSKLNNKKITNDEFIESSNKILSKINNVFIDLDNPYKMLQRIYKEEEAIEDIKKAIESGKIPSFYKEFKQKNSTERAIWVSETLKKYEGKNIPSDVVREIEIYSRLGLIKNKEIDKIRIYKSKY